MKLAIPARGETLDAPMDPRFGRCSTFVIVDEDTGGIEALPNEQNRQAAQGAGVQAGQTVAASGASVVLTGHCGPKAFRVLQAADVRVYLVEAATVSEALETWRRGGLAPLETADVEGHWA